MKSDLWRAVEAKRKAYRSDTSIDIELHLANLEVTHDVLLAHGRQDEGAVKRHPDLAAVGVAREHEVDELAARMLDHRVGVVRLMNHENDRAVWLLRDG